LVWWVDFIVWVSSFEVHVNNMYNACYVGSDAFRSRISSLEGHDMQFQRLYASSLCKKPPNAPGYAGIFNASIFKSAAPPLRLI
jgi:hypothetical protein